MTQFDTVDLLLQELQALQQSLEILDSLDTTLTTYEKMFSLIYKGFHQISNQDQQSHLLSLTPQGELLKDALGNPVTQIFSVSPNS